MKYLQRILVGLLAVVALLAIALVVWATVSAQDPTARAQEILQTNGVERVDGRLVFQPEQPTTQGLIYYPGGLVEPEAYAGTGQGLADEGYLVIIPKMPLNLAFTGTNKADDIMSDFPEIESWVIGGHSLGGAMAAEYAKNNVDTLDGLILYASYPANYDEFINFPIPIMSVIGSSDPGSVEQTAFYETIQDTATLSIVEGGNHLQYADYSLQRGDGVATISPAEQQAQIVAATVQFFEMID